MIYAWTQRSLAESPGLAASHSGAGLNYLAAKRTRPQLNAGNANRLDTLVNSWQPSTWTRRSLRRRALDAGHDISLADRYGNVRRTWKDGWVRYSPRIHQAEVLARYESVGSILAEVVPGDRTACEAPRHVCRSCYRKRPSHAWLLPARRAVTAYSLTRAKGRNPGRWHRGAHAFSP
jgi:hypothetical protein